MVVIVRLNVVYSPVFVVISQIGGREIIRANLNNLDYQTNQSLERHRPIKPLSSLVEIIYLQDARNTEPDIVGQIPRLMDAVVFLSPWPDIIEHKYMQKKVFSA